MPRLTRIYTRTGDDGTTGLGSGERVPKTSLRIAAYGTVDELNAQIGVVAATPGLDAQLAAELRRIQHELFHLGSELCVPEPAKASFPVPRIEERHVAALEQSIDRMNGLLPALSNFVLPGGHPAAAALHVARTVCRRAERDVLTLREKEPVGPLAVKYLNRLSDGLFVMTRYQNVRAGVPEPTWDSRA